MEGQNLCENDIHIHALEGQDLCRNDTLTHPSPGKGGTLMGVTLTPALDPLPDMLKYTKIHSLPAFFLLIFGRYIP